MIKIEIGEVGPGTSVPISAEQRLLLARSGVVNAVPSPYLPGWWLISAAGKVGAARIGDAEIYIKPKMAIHRLLFLAGYAEYGPAWRSDDVTVESATDLVPAAADALWRQVARAIQAEAPAGYPNADLYQLLAYCTVLGLEHGHLVYAKGDQEPSRHAVRRSGIEVHCHALDLAAEPAAVLGQIRELADRIASYSRRRERVAIPWSLAAREIGHQ